MATYIIEGGIDFNEELQKIQENEDDTNVCLISGMPLEENFVVLECMHKFNYLSIYNDVLNHKRKFNTLETKHIKSTEIRCPYCRHVQSSLLPYYEMPGVSLIHGVNFFDVSKKPVRKTQTWTGECECTGLSSLMAHCKNKATWISSTAHADVTYIICKMTTNTQCIKLLKFYENAAKKKQAIEEKTKSAAMKVIADALKTAFKQTKKDEIKEEKAKAKEEKAKAKEEKEKLKEEKLKLKEEKLKLKEEKKKALEEKKKALEEKKKALAEKKKALEEKKKALEEKKKEKEKEKKHIIT